MLTFGSLFSAICGRAALCRWILSDEFAVLLQSDMTIRNPAVMEVQCPSAAGCSTPASVRPEQRAAIEDALDQLHMMNGKKWAFG